MINSGQVKRIQSHYSGTARDERLKQISDYFGRTVESITTLTEAEADRFIKTLPASRGYSKNGDYPF